MKMDKGGGRRVAYRDSNDACTMDYECWTSASWSPNMRSSYQWAREAPSNPLHAGEHFIAEGAKYAERANRMTWKAALVLIGAIIAFGVAFHFGI